MKVLHIHVKSEGGLDGLAKAWTVRKRFLIFAAVGLFIAVSPCAVGVKAIDPTAAMEILTVLMWALAR